MLQNNISLMELFPCAPNMCLCVCSSVCFHVSRFVLYLVCVCRYETRVRQEKAAMDAQITRTMKGFQEQLAQSVKMAAMMQAQRIMTGGTSPVQQATAPTLALPLEVDDPPSKCAGARLGCTGFNF